MRWHYGIDPDKRGLAETRGNACEIVAWRFLTRLSERDAVDFCLYEIPDPDSDAGPSASEHNGDPEQNETAPLLYQTAWGGTSRSAVSDAPSKASRRDMVRMGSTSRRTQLLESISRLTIPFTGDGSDDEDDDPTAPFINLNALEIAAIADAKRFLSQHVVQKIITGIWEGDIIFWEHLSVNSTKKPRYYNSRTADPFSRLRVPKYLKSFEVVWFGTFLALYYAVLVERNPEKISTIEVLLYVWFVAFLYDEVSEWIDAGSIFYVADVWNIFDVIMIVIGLVFAAMSKSSPCPP